MGHGRYEAADGELAFCGPDGRADWVEGLRIAQLAYRPDLRLVLLNACDGAVASSADAFTSVAARLVRRGVPR